MGTHGFWKLSSRGSSRWVREANVEDNESWWRSSGLLLFLSSRERSLQVGHHLYVDVIHSAGVQTVQFDTSKHAVKKQMYDSSIFNQHL